MLEVKTMKKIVTISDIANALGLSRNTVSKALNGQYVMPKTKKLVISTAIKMGYKNYDVISNNVMRMQKRILILSSVPLLSSPYYIFLLNGISNEAEKYGLEVIQYVFKPHSNIETLKNYVFQFDINGIVCIEFFDAKMFKEIVSLNIPTVFLDCPASEYELNGNFDVLLSESIMSTANVCNKLIKTGMSVFSFVGNPNNSRSFNERFMGMREALFQNNINFDKDLSIITEDNEIYNNVSLLAQQISSLKTLPHCFVCANDYLALKTISALKSINLADFDKINVVGFDNGPESKSSDPQLSTINVNKSALGINAVHVLIDRMLTTKKTCKLIYLSSYFIKRNTTNALKSKQKN